MLKAKATLHDGRPLYMIGLSEGNLERLRQRRPIWFDMSEIGGSGQMLIFWGPTEESMAEELAPFIPEQPRGD